MKPIHKITREFAHGCRRWDKAAEATVEVERVSVSRSWIEIHEVA